MKKESACNVGDLGLIPWLGRSSGGGNATHSSILACRIPMDRGAWQATVHGVAMSWTRLTAHISQLNRRPQYSPIHSCTQLTVITNAAYSPENSTKHSGENEDEKRWITPFYYYKDSFYLTDTPQGSQGPLGVTRPHSLENWESRITSWFWDPLSWSLWYFS